MGERPLKSFPAICKNYGFVKRAVREKTMKKKYDKVDCRKLSLQNQDRDAAFT